MPWSRSGGSNTALSRRMADHREEHGPARRDAVAGTDRYGGRLPFGLLRARKDQREYRRRAGFAVRAQSHGGGGGRGRRVSKAERQLQRPRGIAESAGTQREENRSEKRFDR